MRMGFFAPGRNACYTANMSPELIGIITVGASLAALIIGLFAWLRQDIKEQGKDIKERGKEIAEVRKEVKEQGNELRKEVKEQGDELHKEMTEVKVEVAALKATVETYFRVRVDPPRQAAVAETPEDYDAG